MSIQEPPAYGRPEPTAHQRVDLGQSVPLEQDRLARPLTGAFPKDAASNLGLVRLERRVVRSRHGRLVPASSSIYSVQFRDRRGIANFRRPPLPSYVRIGCVSWLHPQSERVSLSVPLFRDVSRSFPRSRNRDEPDEEDLGPEDHISGLRENGR